VQEINAEYFLPNEINLQSNIVKFSSNNEKFKTKIKKSSNTKYNQKLKSANFLFASKNNNVIEISSDDESSINISTKDTST
jgi:hypothetical protein